MNPQRQPDELDRLLEAHLGPSTNATDHLIPSSGFAHSVMDAIHQQTTAPPPIPFPWKRLLPAAIALVATLLASVFLATSPSAASLARTISINLAWSTTTATTISIICAVTAASIATTAISFKLATGRFRN